MILNETYDEILERLDSYSLNEGFFSDRKKKKEDRKKKREEKRKEKIRESIKKYNDQLPEEYKKMGRDYCRDITNKFKSWKSSPYTLVDVTKDILVVAAYNDITNDELVKIGNKIKSKVIFEDDDYEIYVEDNKLKEIYVEDDKLKADPKPFDISSWKNESIFIDGDSDKELAYEDYLYFMGRL